MESDESLGPAQRGGRMRRLYIHRADRDLARITPGAAGAKVTDRKSVV